MTKYLFWVEDKWKVVVYFDIDYNLFDFIVDDLYAAGASKNNVNNIYHTMRHKGGKAFTFSNIKKHVSIMGFNRHSEYYDYLNSIAHETEHVKQAMLDAYNIEDKGELPAYTIGYLFVKIYKVFKGLMS